MFKVRKSKLKLVAAASSCCPTLSHKSQSVCGWRMVRETAGCCCGCMCVTGRCLIAAYVGVCAHTFKFMPMPKRWLWQICHAPMAALPCGNLGKGAGEGGGERGEEGRAVEAEEPVAHCDPKVDPEKRLLWFAWLVCLFIGQRGAFYANPKINTQVFIISMHTAHSTHTARPKQIEIK